MRYYSSVASSKVLDSPVSNVATSITLNNVTGLPITYPYTLVIEPDTGNEEIVLVTGGSGSVLTIVRGANTDNGVVGGDGTSARAHDAGVVVKHMVTARDLQEPQNHMNAATLVHGLGAGEGAVVGVDKIQTLTNKTLTSPTLTGTPIAPTATSGTNTTQVATTAFVQDAVLALAPSGVAYVASYTSGAITLSGTSGILDVPFTVDEIDNISMHDTSTNNERFNPNVSGNYLIQTIISIKNTNSSAVNIEALIAKNAGSGTTKNYTAPGNSEANFVIYRVHSMNGSTDYFKLRIENKSSGSVTYNAYLFAIRLGA